MDLHTREILDEQTYENEEDALRMTAEEVRDFDAKGPRDILTYVWFDPGAPPAEQDPGPSTHFFLEGRG